MPTWRDLKNNPALWQIFFLREKLICSIREFFQKEKFHEVQTPLLLPSVIPESYLEYFETYLFNRKRKKQKAFLATSPEASIKKLLVAGLGNCFEITKSFRNTETDSYLHFPEFTILEWYRVGANYCQIMQDCEKLILFLGKKLQKNLKGTQKKAQKTQIFFQGKYIDIAPPWEKISIPQALEKYAGITFEEITSQKNEIFSPDKIAQVAQKKGYNVEKTSTWEEIFNQIFLNEIEPHLGTHGKPTIVYDYPLPMAALAKAKKDDPRLAERFEFYIGGLELGDCYSELTNYQEQKRRFSEEQKIREKARKIKILADLDFLDALKVGLPECAGIAVGVDRLVMLFADTKDIKETLFFPS